MFDYFTAVQVTPITFAAKIVHLKVYIIRVQSKDLVLHWRSNLRLKLDKCLAVIITAISRAVFELWHPHLARR